MRAVFPLQPTCSSLKYQSIFRRWQDSQCQIIRQYFDLRIDLYLCYNSEARHINPEVLKISKSAPSRWWRWRWQQAEIGIGSGYWTSRAEIVTRVGSQSQPDTGLILMTAPIKREYKMKQTTSCPAGVMEFICSVYVSGLAAVLTVNNVNNLSICFNNRPSS